jgi:PPM family protein phosphatase
MRFSIFQLSRKGGRQNNEDRMGYCYTRDAALLVLADGMGGHPEGEVAAQLALQTASSVFQQEAKPTIVDPEQFLVRTLMAAHHQILKYASDKGMLDSPRTTVVMCLLQNGHAHWIHCGDSRLYLMRKGAMLARTRDHSYAEQVNKGVVMPMTNMNRNVLMTCLGSYAKPLYDVGGPHQLNSGDRLMLCSDGLWGSLNEDKIVHMSSEGSISDVVPSLVEEALRTAGEKSDNVTVIALEWESEEDFQSTRGVITDTISEGVFASTIQAAVGDPLDELDDLDEEAIERSIAEINEAIRRSGVTLRK